MKLPPRLSRRLHRWRKFGLIPQILERFYIDYANSESTSPPLQVSPFQIRLYCTLTAAIADTRRPSVDTHWTPYAIWGHYTIPYLYPQQHYLPYSSLIAVQMLYPEASYMLISNRALTARFRSRWVAANFGRHEYAKLAQRRPAFSQQ